VPVDDGVTTGKASREPLLPTRARPGDVHHPDPRAPGLDDEIARERLTQRGLVHVPEHRVYWPQRAQLVQHRLRDEVARVEDQVGPLEAPDALVRDSPRPARQVCVRDDGYAGQRTTNGSPITVVDRSGFIDAANRIAVT